MNRDFSRSRAILISNAVFSDDGISDLPAVAGCAPAMESLLTGELCEWPADRVTSLENVGAPPELARSLVGLTKGVQDVLLLYYAGHGLRLPNGQLALALRDTSSDRELVRHTAAVYKDVAEMLRGCPAATKLVILDCCHAELGNRDSFQFQSADIEAEPVDGLYCIWASKELENAKSPVAGGLTYFTEAFLEVVRTGIPGKPAQVTLDQIFVELRARMLRACRPEPARSGIRDANHWPFARNAARAESRDDQDGGSFLEWRDAAEARERAMQARIEELARQLERLQALASSAPSAREQRDIQGSIDSTARQLADTAAEAAGQPAGRQAAPPGWPPEPERRVLAGFDLGTTNSMVAVLTDDGRPTIVRDAEGREATPSLVAFDQKGEVLVGEAARRGRPDRTIRSVKRHMGTDWSVTIDGKKFNPQQISAFILRKLKRDAEAYLGEKITDAVITVPAYFSDAQRQATKEAGTIAGLNVLGLINDPAAAAITCRPKPGMRRRKRTILVFDLGGGTLDVSVVEVRGGAVEVAATRGDSHLGGDDWDDQIVQWLVNDFKSVHGIDLAKDKLALPRLREAAERAKAELSIHTETVIDRPYICHGPDGPLHLETRLTRAEFQRMTSGLIDRCKARLERVVNDVSGKVAVIDDCLLVGASAQMPAVVDLVKSVTGKESTWSENVYPPVAAGACQWAGVARSESPDLMLLDVASLSLGIETKGGVFTKVIERNTTIPVKRREIFTTADDNQRSILIRVFQGERELAAYNESIGVFELDGLVPAPRGVPQIEVSFEIDADGMVHVSAVDLITGKPQSVKVTGGSALPQDALQRMTRDAEQYAEAGPKRRQGPKSTRQHSGG
jgi:molecular chaperone DnaK